MKDITRLWEKVAVVRDENQRMIRSSAPDEAISKAKKRLADMKAATSFKEFESAWRDFLLALERAWNKTEAHFSKSPKWAGWASTYYTQRRKDDLLSYLTQARNVDEHSVAPIAESKSIWTFNPAEESGNFEFEKLVIGPKGELVSFESKSPAVVTYRPKVVRLLPVTNRGRTYLPPTTHLGKYIEDRKVLDLAEMAVEYYQSALNAAEAFFYPSK